MRHKSLWLFLVPVLSLVFVAGITFIWFGNSRTTASSTIYSLEGEVQIKKAGSTEWLKAESKASLSENDVVKTSANSTASIIFFDGSIIDLEPETQLEIKELTKGKAKSIKLRQDIGETLSKVKKLADPASRYEIETPASVAGVRGSTMFVKVEFDGTTTVANIQGAVSVIAQGAEVAIPEGKHSTVIPGATPSPPLEGTASTILSTPVLTDTVSDWFDSQKRPVTGPEYLDIDFSHISFVDGKWIMKLGLRGEPPAANAVTANTLIEWDFLIDFDQDPATGLSRPFISNDIGYDYLLQFSLENNKYKCTLIDINMGTSEIVDSAIHDKIVEMVIPLTAGQGTAITSPPNIDWVVTTIYYGDDDPRDQPSFTDKAPNEGHYLFP